ncbi:MAG: flagellar protein FliT [Burkholderiales bacterium]|nr:flagellar protein FliT [Burkholderiales bacterium]
MKTIDLYQSIAEASRQMVDAARAADWDALVGAEKECASRVAILRQRQAGSAAALDAGDEQHRMRLLREILAHDAEIRELTTPWLRRLEQLIAGASYERRVGDAYRADFG